MSENLFRHARSSALVSIALGLLVIGLPKAWANAEVEGISGSTFNLIAAETTIGTFDGNSLHVWAYDGGDPNIFFGGPQYPGPTLIVEQGALVTVNLLNNLPAFTSIVFPGQTGVTASGDAGAGALTAEAMANGGVATYSFRASRPGTFLYHSGSNAQLQTEMGLVGALIVRPTQPGQAYGHADTAYVHEYLSLVTQMDPSIHYAVANGQINSIDMTNYRPVYWFINGRNWPNTVAPSYTPVWPSQPYGAKPRTRPGEVTLMRLINGGRTAHPWHTHGNHADVIARDGRLLESAPGAGPDLSFGDFTVQVHPGATFDILFKWTGEGLGWDVYGDPLDPEFSHTCIADVDNQSPFDATTGEYCPDHGKQIPVDLPETLTVGIGGFYSGSPFMGREGGLPPGEGGLNENGGLHYLWHSHNAFEQVNNDQPPGGMTTMLVVEPPGTPIP